VRRCPDGGQEEEKENLYGRQGRPRNGARTGRKSQALTPVPAKKSKPEKYKPTLGKLLAEE
jgi:hypothetical protein